MPTFTIVHLPKGQFAVECGGNRFPNNFGHLTSSYTDTHVFKFGGKDYIAFTAHHNILGIRCEVVKFEVMPCGECDKSL